MAGIDKKFEEAISEVQTKGAKKTAADWLAQIEEEFGTSPLIYQKLEDNPQALIAHLLYKNAVTSAGALPPKTVELISLAVGAALRCDHCTMYHMQVAKKMGVTNEEILEAVLVAGLLANSSVLANAYRLVVPEKEPCAGTCALQ